MELQHLLADQQKYADNLIKWKENSITNIGNAKDPNVISTLLNWILWLSKTKTLENAKSSFYYIFRYISTLLSSLPIVIVLSFVCLSWFYILRVEHKIDNEHKNKQFVVYAARRSFIPFTVLLLIPYLLFVCISMGSDFMSNVTTYLTETRGVVLLQKRAEHVTQGVLDRAFYNLCSDLRKNVRSVSGMYEGRTADDMYKAVSKLAGTK